MSEIIDTGMMDNAIGNSGARILTTLVHELKRSGKKEGVAFLCLGGGNSVSLAVERDLRFKI